MAAPGGIACGIGGRDCKASIVNSTTVEIQQIRINSVYIYREERETLFATPTSCSSSSLPRPAYLALLTHFEPAAGAVAAGAEGVHGEKEVK